MVSTDCAGSKWRYVYVRDDLKDRASREEAAPGNGKPLGSRVLAKAQSRLPEYPFANGLKRRRSADECEDLTRIDRLLLPGCCAPRPFVIDMNILTSHSRDSPTDELL